VPRRYKMVKIKVVNRPNNAVKAALPTKMFNAATGQSVTKKAPNQVMTSYACGKPAGRGKGGGK
jgi:hypothetical protein